MSIYDLIVVLRSRLWFSVREPGKNYGNMDFLTDLWDRDSG